MGEFMSASADFSEVPPFEMFVGQNGQTIPFVFNSPHSGRHYPPRFLAMSRLDSLSIRRSEDCYVDELFAGSVHLGAAFLCANFPRAYLDANREPWELDPRMFCERVPPFANIHSPRVAGGLGTLPKLVADGMDIYEQRLPVAEAMSRIEQFYMPYHATLRELLHQTRARFGHAILVDCHSMPKNIRVAQGDIRPDIIIGDRYGTSAFGEFTRLAISLLSAKGYAVEQNRPYAGGFITEHYGRPMQNIHALQIEVNRGLYLDDQTLEPSDGFSALREDLSEFMRDFVAISRSFLPDVPLAAE
ncbi:N-formylglutamate amidohydrolase [Nitratireductor aestuarii]|uniref:N-formylglutamate amidohydrolase n=2 Tax=Nitratireductor aestuarii TaxID=1735103 RepID=A0A916RNW6_9HYPH|nr:N-formylglutamate amidohydrolase [Nitratireductor aestuarii]